MINKIVPLSMAEVNHLIGKAEGDKEKEFVVFLKKFSKIKFDKASKIKEELEKLEIIKLKPEHIVKIIDFMPESAVGLNKIFANESLDEDEFNKILEVVKNNK